MKAISLRDELAIMHGTRGAKIPAPYAVNGSHYHSLKAAVIAAKNTNVIVGGCRMLQKQRATRLV
jgi:hypothetical protein